jgi:hypothetical protein
LGRECLGESVWLNTHRPFAFFRTGPLARLDAAELAAGATFAPLREAVPGRIVRSLTESLWLQTCLLARPYPYLLDFCRQ